MKLKVVSERLGHSSVAFTMTAYQLVMPGMQAVAFGDAVYGQGTAFPYSDTRDGLCAINSS